MLKVEQLYSTLRTMMERGQGDFEVRIAAKESGKLVEAILTENYAIHDDGIYLEDDFHYQELPTEVKTMLEDRIQIYGDETRRLRD